MKTFLPLFIIILLLSSCNKTEQTAKPLALKDLVRLLSGTYIDKEPATSSIDTLVIMSKDDTLLTLNGSNRFIFTGNLNVHFYEFTSIDKAREFITFDERLDTIRYHMVSTVPLFGSLDWRIVGAKIR